MEVPHTIPGTASAWACHPSMGPCLWQLTLLIQIQAGEPSQSPETVGYKYIVGSLAKSHVWSSAAQVLVLRRMEIFFIGEAFWLFLGCFLLWLTYSYCTYSVFHATDPPFIAQPSQPVTQLCGSSLEGFQCLSSSELGVLHTVCGLLEGRTKGWDLQNKESLVTLQAYSAYSLCRHSVYHKVKEILCVTLLHHIFIHTSLFIETPRSFLESLLFPHHPPIASLHLSQEQELTNSNVLAPVQGPLMWW